MRQFLVGTRGSVGSMTGRSVYSAAKALERAAEIRSVGSSEVTFADAATGRAVTEAEVKQIAEKERGA